MGNEKLERNGAVAREIIALAHGEQGYVYVVKRSRLNEVLMEPISLKRRLV